jgi:hypothetical protein
LILWVPQGTAATRAAELEARFPGLDVRAGSHFLWVPSWKQDLLKEYVGKSEGDWKLILEALQETRSFTRSWDGQAVQEQGYFESDFRAYEAQVQRWRESAPKGVEYQEMVDQQELEQLKRHYGFWGTLFIRAFKPQGHFDKVMDIAGAMGGYKGLARAEPGGLALIPREPGGPVPATRGIYAPAGKRFLQDNFGLEFSLEGSLKGQPLHRVVMDLRAGELSPEQVPINTITRGGQTYIVNTRSFAAVTLAGKKPAFVDVTGKPEWEAWLNKRLRETAGQSWDVVYPRGDVAFPR